MTIPTYIPTNLPQIKILATGGTIAGSAASSTQMTDYKAGTLTIDTLLSTIPEAQKIAVISSEQLANIDSQDMTTDVLLALANRCNAILHSSEADGIVITHGTDTLEETAYFLNLTIQSPKPVILVGAMRPATAISADGPINLLNAIKLATSPKAIGRGVLVAMNDEICSARDVAKTNTSNLSAFKAPGLGFLGYFTGGEPYFYNESTRRHTIQSEFDTASLHGLPRVDIIYTHANDDRVLIDAAAAAGAKGIVYAGSGMGGIHKDAEPGLIDAQRRGVAIVRSSRTGNGMVVASLQRWTAAHFINGDTLNPQKARILLQLALTKTTNPAEIQRMFDEY